MPLTLLRHATQKPPIGPLKLDIGNLLVNGLVGAWAFSDIGNSNVWNAVNSHDVLALGSASTWTSGKTGSGVASTGFNSGLQLLSPSPSLEPTAAVSMFWYGTFNASLAGTNPRLSMDFDNSNGSPFVCYGFFRSNTTDITAGWNNGSLQTMSLTGAIDTSNYGRIQSLGFAMDGASVRGFVDGLFKNSSSSGVGAITYNAASNLAVGGFPAGSDVFGCVTTALYIWNRKLADAEFAGLHAEPYAMFQTRPMQRWFTVVSAGGATIPPGLGPVVSLTEPTLTADLSSMMR